MFNTLARKCNGNAYLSAETIIEVMQSHGFGDVDAAMMDRVEGRGSEQITLDLAGKFATVPELMTGISPEDISEPPKAAKLKKDTTIWGSETAIADDFADQHHRDFKFVMEYDWLVRDGTRWAKDKIFTPWAKIKPIALNHAAKLDRADSKRKVASRSTQAGALGLARGDHRIITTLEQWDANPDVLNTRGGAVSLTPENPAGNEDLFMKSTSVSPNRGSHPLWDRFLAQITASDAELQKYLQRVAGYCLTGSVKEQKFFFFHGSGRNGKGVFLRTLCAIMGDYAQFAPRGMFEERAYQPHTTELARLNGARLVVSDETTENSYWDVAKLKSLTGADPITARFMRQDDTTFIPQFKLVIPGNYKPRIRTLDPAICERLCLVPFTVSFAGAPDLDLEKKLIAEHGAILQWAIDGCHEWQRIGLAAPPAVRRATQEYFGTQDMLASWIADCCVLDRDAHTPSGDLFTSWCAYRRSAGEPEETQRAFSDRLIRADFVNGPAKNKSQRQGFFGIRLASTDPIP